MPNLLDYRHPDYETRKRRSTFAELYRTGRVQDKVEESARRDDGTRIQQGSLHLQRRSQGETIDAYRERAYVSRYPRHFGRVVTSFVGSLMQSEEKASRQWSDALGSPQEDGTLMARYYEDIDGQGTPLKQCLQSIADTLVTSHRQWYLLDPPSDSGLAKLHLLPEKDVLNWVTQDGRLVDVLIREHIDDRTSIEQEPGSQETFLRYTLDGWTRYRKEEDGFSVPDEGEWDPGFYRTTDREEKRLPMGYIDLGLGEPVGYNMARGARYLYNLLSDIRWAIRRTSFSKLAPEKEALTEEEYELASRALEDGHNFLTFPAQYIAPDAGVFTGAYDIYKQEVRDFYVTALQSYEDAAKERTATEIMQDESEGRFSFLAVLARAMDKVEQDIYNLLHQVEVPNDPAAWEEVSVTRSRDFQPVDAENKADTLMEAAFGPNAVPLGEQGTTDVATTVGDLLGIEYDEEEVETAVQNRRDRAAQSPTDGPLVG